MVGVRVKISEPDKNSSFNVAKHLKIRKVTAKLVTWFSV